MNEPELVRSKTKKKKKTSQLYCNSALYCKTTLYNALRRSFKTISIIKRNTITLSYTSECVWMSGVCVCMCVGGGGGGAGVLQALICFFNQGRLEGN